MKPSEVADLLSLSLEIDRYATADKMTKERAVAWAATIGAKAPGMTFDAAQRVVIDYYADGGDSLQVGDLIIVWRKKNAADVRAARSRGLIGRDHSEHQALPPAVNRALAEARERDRATAAQYAVEGSAVSPLQLDVGRRP
ncbi:hypothetical protein MUN78_16420 [Leucobacter allii]|uniref:Uncharacterized protein n=1 Tax=Leucobacter allii TaxID=2932247 RepID=A0ABY4FLS2_9MICO|nr:hypothetical protein [Leucobacter allii]UOQ57215.1 hypothetical protein MUN78_16420 [Leucobacter allii]